MAALNEALWSFKNRFPTVAWALRWTRPSRVAEWLRVRGKTTQEIFEKIYRENRWGMTESRSGAGSTLKNTEHLRAELPRLVGRLGATSLLDAPCGDLNWMKHCDLGVPYTGGEIVATLVDELRAKHASATPPVRSFVHLDITRDPLPQADIFFCRDCFLHLSFAHIHAALDNFRRSSARYLVTSTYRQILTNVDHFTGGVRMVNLELPPFNLPPPLEYIDDRGEASFPRCLGVWTREQVVDAARS